MGAYKRIVYWINEVPHHLKTQPMCIEAAETNPRQLEYVSNHFRTREMCDKAVHMDLQLLNYVPNWFVTQGQLKLWHDDYDDDDRLIKWSDDYQKLKDQKANIKEELMRIA